MATQALRHCERAVRQAAPHLSGSGTRQGRAATHLQVVPYLCKLGRCERLVRAAASPQLQARQPTAFPRVLR